MVQGVFSWVDLVMTPIWLLLLYLLAYSISHTRYRNTYLRRHFMLGFTAKIVGCFGFIAVYALYYGYGDTFGYFEAATELRRILIQDPGRIISTISATALDSSSHGNMGIRFFDSSYINPSNYTVVRFTLLFGILTYNSYLA